MQYTIKSHPEQGFYKFQFALIEIPQIIPKFSQKILTNLP